MSPEQVRGKDLDARTDLFSFGAVLYEMCTGTLPFRGDTSGVIFNAILDATPTSAVRLNPDLPAELEQIVTKCLEKDRNLRYQHASDVRTDVQRLKRDTESGRVSAQVPARPQLSRHRGPLFYGSALAIVLLVLGFGFRGLKNRQIAHKETSERQLTHSPVEHRLLGCAISPDGKHLAYTDTRGLHLSVIETGEVHDIPLPEELRTHLWDVSWLSDGERLLFETESETEGYTMWLISVFGGTPHKMISESVFLQFSASPQGSLIAYVGAQGREVWVMGTNGENPKRLLGSEKDTYYRAVAWAPTGNRLVYERFTRGVNAPIIETVSANGGAASLVISDARLSGPLLLWVPDGRLLFSFAETDNPAELARDIWGIMVDPQTGKPSGKPVRITDSHGLTLWNASVSRDGRRLVINKQHTRLDVYVGELNEEGTRLDSPTRLSESDSYDQVSGWTHDSKAVLFASNRMGRSQIFKQPLGQDTAEPLIQGPEDEMSAKLSPDGNWILYYSVPHRVGGVPRTTYRLMRISALGGTPEKVMDLGENDSGFDCPSRSGTFCVLGRLEQGQLVFYSLDPVRGLSKELARTKLGSPADWSISPDGLRVAISDWRELPEQVRVLDLRNGTERNISLPHGWSLWAHDWAADSNTLFAAAQSKSTGYMITRIELNGKTRVLLDLGRSQWVSMPRSSPDGHHLAFSQQTFDNNAWLLEDF